MALPPPELPQTPAIPAYALRLRPGQDLRASLAEFAQQQQLTAGVILTAVGSLNPAALRFATAAAATTIAGPVEIVSVVGTLSVDGLHVHLAVADADGKTYGGHLMAGCVVYTTVELAIANLPQYRFQRAFDADTGYRELQIQPRSPGA